MEVALGPQVGDGEPQNGQSIEFGQNVLFEGKEPRQVIELRVQPFSMPLGRVALGLSVFRLRLYAEEEIEKEVLALSCEGCEVWREGSAFACGGRKKRMCACVRLCMSFF